MRAPVLGGNFGVWGGLFSTFDCAVKGIRGKEDPYNPIIAGFFTGGSLAIRGGFRAARNGAIGCAILLAVIEGVAIGIQRFMAPSTKIEVPLRLPFFYLSPPLTCFRKTSLLFVCLLTCAQNISPGPPSAGNYNIINPLAGVVRRTSSYLFGVRNFNSSRFGLASSSIVSNHIFVLEHFSPLHKIQQKES